MPRKRRPMNSDVGSGGSLPFEVHQSSHDLIVLKLLDPMSQGFFTKLSHTIEESSMDLKEAPVILDLDHLPAAMVGFTFTGFIGRLRHLHLIVIGVQGGTTHQQNWARDSGLVVFPSTPLDPLSSPSLPEKRESQVSVQYSTPDLIEEQIIRSGRQMYAENSNLVLISSVRSGGEVMADGDIHIYGRLEGRALAGCRGNKNARIFCQVMAAEMLSIAGQFVTHENIDGQYAYYKGKPICVFLKDNTLCMNVLEY